MRVFLPSASKLLDRAAHVFVVTEVAVGSKERDAVGFANVGTLHEHIHGGGVGEQLGLVVGHLMGMIVVAQVIVIVCAKGIEWGVVTQHAFVGTSVFAKQSNAVVAKTNQGWV